MGNLAGILYAIVSSATFGLIPLFSIPLLMNGVGEPSILFYRMGIAAILMGIIARLRGNRLRLSMRDIPVFVYLGALYAMTSFGLLASYNYIPSGVATTIHFLYPLVVALIMVLFFRERSSAWLLLAAVVSLIGVALLSWSEGERSNVVGVLLVLMTVVTYAVYIVSVNKSRVRTINSSVLTFYVLLMSAVFFLIYALCTSGIDRLPTVRAVADASLLALLSTVISNLTLVMAVKKIGSTTTSVLGSMEPLTAMLVGVFYFGESFGLRSGVGMGLIVVSVIVVILSGRPGGRNE